MELQTVILTKGVFSNNISYFKIFGESKKLENLPDVLTQLHIECDNFYSDNLKYFN